MAVAPASSWGEAGATAILHGVVDEVGDRALEVVGAAAHEDMAGPFQADRRADVAEDGHGAPGEGQTTLIELASVVQTVCDGFSDIGAAAMSLNPSQTVCTTEASSISVVWPSPGAPCPSRT
jgi:hypothetical protein